MKSFTNFRQQLDEAKGKKNSKTSSLPAVLVMKRQSMRQYPGNKTIALYYISAIDKYVTIPYNMDEILGVSEENNLG
jgi:hypothetical protein